MKNQVLIAAGAVALTTLSIPQNARAQAWIGQVVGDMMAQQQAAIARAECMNGASPETKEIEEALVSANNTMQGYFAGQQSSGDPRSEFFAVDKHTAWTHGNATLSRVNIDQGTDALAAAGMSIDTEPFAFYRSYLHARATGQWPVRDATGQVTGVYTAYFVRKLNTWKLRTLTLEDASAYSGPVVQFCEAPGDVLPHQIESSASSMNYHAKRMAKAKDKLGRARDSLVKQEQKLADKPDSARRKESHARAEEKVRKWEGELLERSTAFETAAMKNRQALREQAELPTKQAQAKAALGITG
ncbi:MAG: hypothetical protein AAGK02_13655 [Pseudomonadota bacterium]